MLARDQRNSLKARIPMCVKMSSYLQWAWSESPITCKAALLVGVRVQPKGHHQNRRPLLLFLLQLFLLLRAVNAAFQQTACVSLWGQDSTALWRRCLGSLTCAELGEVVQRPSWREERPHSHGCRYNVHRRQTAFIQRVQQRQTGDQQMETHHHNDDPPAALLAALEEHHTPERV